MYLPDLVIRSRRVVSSGGVRAAAIHVRNGRIVGVLDFDDVPANCPTDDLGEFAILPGAVDSHVHVNEPGRTDWEGFESATRSAAAGGVTAIVDMPLNSVPATTTLSALEVKRQSARGKCFVDVGFWGGVVPGNVPELAALVEAGVCGFKCFLVPSGVDEFRAVSEADLRTTMPALTKLGTTLLAHAELSGPIEHASIAAGAQHSWVAHVSRSARQRPRQYETYLRSRPKEAENDAVRLLIDLCRAYRTRTHIVHLSSCDALTPIFYARTARLPITAETCPHYLYFAAEDVPDGATSFKCAPPIRARDNREFLWAALANGLIQLVVSDHSPAPPELKQVESGDFLKAWGGIASLQLSLPIVWTAAHARGYALQQVADWMCRAPSDLAGLARKGRIEVGYDADLVVFDPEGEFVVERSLLHHRHPITPYLGERLRGVVQRTYLRGAVVYERGQAAWPQQRGELLVRSR